MRRRLDSLKIEGFRALSFLHIERLGGVNLVVGKNSTGKTTILEALRLLMTRDVRARLYQLLNDREEYLLKRRIVEPRTGGPDSGPPLAYEALFSGRPDLETAPEFRITAAISGNGSLFPELRTSVRFSWLNQLRDSEDASVRYTMGDGPDFDPDVVPGFVIEAGDARSLLPLDRLNRMYVRRRIREGFDDDVVFLPSSGMDMAEIGEMWDSIALTDDEDQVIDALRIISPNIEKLVMVQSPYARTDRMLMAKVGDFTSPIPFRSLGEGAIHLLSLALSLIRARGGLLLIDEIANGIHYSVQSKMWELIFSQAARFDVQVVATTHSWDCVRALHVSNSNHNHADTMLFRIENEDRSLKVVPFSAAELAIIHEDQIEVR